MKKNPNERPKVKETIGSDLIIQTMVKMLKSGKFPKGKKVDEEEKKEELTDV